MENNLKLMEIKNPRSKNKLKFKKKTQFLDLILAGNFIILNVMKFVNLSAVLRVQLVKYRQTRTKIERNCQKTINFKRFFLGTKFP